MAQIDSLMGNVLTMKQTSTLLQ